MNVLYSKWMIGQFKKYTKFRKSCFPMEIPFLDQKNDEITKNAKMGLDLAL